MFIVTARLEDDTKILVNPNHVVLVKDYGDGAVISTTLNSRTGTIYVKETKEEVWRMIREVKKIMTTFKDILNKMYEIYERKNADYGNSFSKSYEEFGLVSPVIRLSDKVERLKTLCNKEAQVKDESIIDTLIDIAVYAVLTVLEIKKRETH